MMRSRKLAEDRLNAILQALILQTVVFPMSALRPNCIYDIRVDEEIDFGVNLCALALYVRSVAREVSQYTNSIRLDIN